MLQIISTKDHSHTLKNTEIDENYHSIHGAIQESAYIFIKKGLNYYKSENSFINILEIGMGTGLNVLLTFLENRNKNLKINYVAIEPYPINSEIYQNLNYTQFFDVEGLQDIFIKIHNSNWTYPYYISENFILNKIQDKIENIDFQDDSFHIIYFDAFSPQVQPELWTEAVFNKIYKTMKANSVLTTYSTKGDVKRALKKVGFRIEILEGPIGKRHILRALKDISDFLPQTH